MENMESLSEFQRDQQPLSKKNESTGSIRQTVHAYRRDKHGLINYKEKMNPQVAQDK